MYIYKIGYGSYEESEYCALVHERKWTEDDIDSMIIEAILNIIVGAKRNYVHGYGGIHYLVIDFLIKEKGFEKLEYEVDWSVFGWPSLFDNKDWGTQRGDKLIKITKILNKMGINSKYDSFLEKHNETDSDI